MSWNWNWKRIVLVAIIAWAVLAAVQITLWIGV